MGIEDKIKALSLKTVENGASQAEAEAAMRMIQKLRSPSIVRDKENEAKYADGAYNSMPVNEVDWDAVAKQYLNHFQHAEYVEETHVAWERYNKTRLRLDSKYPMTQSEYRQKCHDAFMRLFERKQIS